MKPGVQVTIGDSMLVAALAGVLLAGCANQFDPPLWGTHATIQFALLSAEENNYVVGSERPPKDTVDQAFPLGHSVQDADTPTMTIATMTPTGSSPFPGVILARITSTGEFPPMGIKPGKNYIWRDPSGTAWITPAIAGAPSHKLQPVPGYQFARESGHQPSLYKVKVKSFAFVACLDDCPSGHCGMY
jgi:hypothetical protein